MTPIFKHRFVIPFFIIIFQITDALPMKSPVQKRLNFNFMRSWLPIEQQQPYVNQQRRQRPTDITEPPYFPLYDQEQTKTAAAAAAPATPILLPIAQTRSPEIVNRLMCIQALGLAAACNMYI